MNPILLDFPHEFTTDRLLLRSPLPGDGAILYEAVLESLDSLKPWMEFVNPVPTMEDLEEYSRLSRSRERICRFTFLIEQPADFWEASDYTVWTGKFGSSRWDTGFETLPEAKDS
jgi:hypothetical protein